MIRFAWIPVVGTIAAVIAVMVSHAPKEGSSPYPFANPRRTERPPPEPFPDEGAETPPLEDEPAVKRDPVVKPDPVKQTVSVQLREDGKLEVADGEIYESVEALLEGLAPDGADRTTIMLSNATGKVTEAALDGVIEELAGKCIPRKVYLAEKQDK